VLAVGAFFVGTLDTVALASSKSKVGEAEYAWSTTSQGTGEDAQCFKEDPETDPGRSLYSVCFYSSARSFTASGSALKQS